jgi:hypothetical protein
MTLDPQFPRGVANGCRSCGCDFSSLEAFDRHRRIWPDHGRNGELLDFDDDDLRAAGFAQSALGRWGIAARIEATRARALSGTLGPREAVS